MRFPSQADPGDAGWHIEASIDKGGDWWVNYRSRGRGLLALYLFSDVDAGSAPTRVRPCSHRDAARVLAPAGDEGMPFMQAARLAAQASAAQPTALITGRAGDVFLCPTPGRKHAPPWQPSGTSRLPARSAVITLRTLITVPAARCGQSPRIYTVGSHKQISSVAFAAGYVHG